MTTFCILSQGPVHLEAMIDKNVASPIERILVKVRVDHSRCNVAARSISVKLEQKINLISDLLLFGQKFYQDTITLAETHERGIAARE